ncbi:MAG: type II secretion system protein J, partial [Acidobacteriota bacterium]
MTPAARRELDSHRAPARGVSLAEVLVAAAISALVFVLALSMLEALMKQYLRAMRDARLQQSVRAAFHRIVADLRNAGLNFNPDGDPARQAEPIEGMWNTAIMVRIDEDMAQATEKLVPEASLAARGGTYKAVSIGNDEIIGYALGAPSGGGAALRFTADVSGTPRDGRQESVMIRHVPIPDQSPPFILYRLRVSRRGTTIT